LGQGSNPAAVGIADRFGYSGNLFGPIEDDDAETTSMATATTESTTTTPAALPSAHSGSSLLPGSLIGTIVFLAGWVGAGFAASAVGTLKLPYTEVFQIVTFLGVLVAATWLAGKAAATNAADGVRGGIITATSILLATFFITSALWTNAEKSMPLQVFTGIILAAGVYGIYWILSSKKGQGICKAIERQGWASFFSHKHTQGPKVRRYTMIGVILIGCLGAVSLYNARMLPASTLTLPLPFIGTPIALLPIADITIPLLLIAATLWISWRLVNVPDFGDFLIATEAEMNKVSWVSRKRLFQDTIVVLVTVVVLTLFLLVIDLFWGWLLSNKYIGVLPSREDTQKMQTNADGGMKLDW
jgi:preprotein translocase SecE subunit